MSQPALSPSDAFARHRPLLDQALSAIAERRYWSPYPESASRSVYGEAAPAGGEAAFKARIGSLVPTGPGDDPVLRSAEISPFGLTLDLSYPAADARALVARASAAAPAWAAVGPEGRVGLALEMLARINRASFEIAHAVQHTTGQAFAMAFQAGGPHAQDRALEAIAYAFRAMAEVPARTVRWEKPQGKNPPLIVDKDYAIVPRGVALVIGCATFPTWNGYPGLFASLVTGNPVIVKPHPMAILPLAISVEIIRQVLVEAGLPPAIVQLAPDRPEAPIAKDLALNPAVRLIDFTGSSQFGRWLEESARQARVYTEKAGVNGVVIGDFRDLAGAARNLAFSFSLYSGQMCTTPQNIFVPQEGIRSGDTHLSFDQVVDHLSQAVAKFLAAPERAVEVLGAIGNPAILERIEAAAGHGRVALESRAIEHPSWPGARIRTPMIVALPAEDRETWLKEWFGPIVFVVPCAGIDQAIARMQDSIQHHGGLTAAIYADDPAVLDQAARAAIAAGVNLSCNLTGGLFVNQSAAFSDFHGTGANPAANAALTDPAFVAERFRVVMIRRPVEAPPVPAPGDKAGVEKASAAP